MSVVYCHAHEKTQKIQKLWLLFTWNGYTHSIDTRHCLRQHSLWGVCSKAGKEPSQKPPGCLRALLHLRHY